MKCPSNIWHKWCWLSLSDDFSPNNASPRLGYEHKTDQSFIKLVSIFGPKSTNQRVLKRSIDQSESLYLLILHPFDSSFILIQQSFNGYNSNSLPLKNQTFMDCCVHKYIMNKEPRGDSKSMHFSFSDTYNDTKTCKLWRGVSH